jgi:hypothetical protein
VRFLPSGSPINSAIDYAAKGPRDTGAALGESTTRSVGPRDLTAEHPQECEAATTPESRGTGEETCGACNPLKTCSLSVFNVLEQNGGVTLPGAKALPVGKNCNFAGSKMADGSYTQLCCRVPRSGGETQKRAVTFWKEAALCPWRGCWTVMPILSILDLGFRVPASRLIEKGPRAGSRSGRWYSESRPSRLLAEQAWAGCRT